MGAGWGTSPPGEQAQLSRGRTSTPLQGSTASNLWPALCFRFNACSANGSLQGASAAALGDTRMGTLARGLPARPSGSRPSPKAQRTSGEHVCAVASGGPSVRPCLAGDGGSNPWGPRERRLGLQRRPEQEARGFEAGEASRAPRGGFCPKLVPVVIGCKAMPSAPSPHGRACGGRETFFVSLLLPSIFFCEFQTCKQAERTASAHDPSSGFSNGQQCPLSLIHHLMKPLKVSCRQQTPREVCF